MKRGFELLITRNISDTLNIEELEFRHKIQLPPIYKLFVKSFVLGEDSLLYNKILDETKYQKTLNYISYEPKPDIVFAGFNELEKVLNIRYLDDIWIEKKYLPIGYCGINGGILLGTIGNETDKIILETVDFEPRFTIIANDIFEFVRGIVLMPLENGM